MQWPRRRIERMISQTQMSLRTSYRFLAPIHDHLDPPRGGLLVAHLCERRSLGLEGVAPAKPREPGVVSVCRDPFSAVLDGDGGKVRVGNQIALYFRCAAQLLEQRPVARTGGQGDAVGALAYCSTNPSAAGVGVGFVKTFGCVTILRKPLSTRSASPNPASSLITASSHARHC